jgi:orotate phosphoribosyltransferase
MAFSSETEAVYLSDDLSRLVEHLKTHAVRTDGGPYTLRSGEESSWYIDARQTTFDGAGARLVGSVVLAMLDPAVDAVGGMTIGADPIALATAIAGAGTGRPLRAFSIRKEAKDHGVGGRLVGPVGVGDRVAMLEDTTTTGGALLESLDVALAAGLRIVDVISLVDRSGGRVASLVQARGLAYRSVVTPSMLGVG